MILRSVLTSTVLKVIICLAFLVLIIARKPDSFFYPQFAAEDGKVWYAGAYNDGFVSVLYPQDGYFQTYSRLAAQVAVRFDLAYGPFIYVLFALLAQFLVVLLLLSERMKRLGPPLFRSLLAFLFLFMPNTFGSYLYLTNSQFYLAISAALLVLVAPEQKQKTYQSVVEFALIGLSVLSGPFVFMLVPLVLFRSYKERSKHALISSCIIVLGACVQALGIFFFDNASRVAHTPVFHFVDLFLVIERQLVWNALISPVGYLAGLDSIPHFPQMAAAVSVPILGLLVYAWWRARIEIKMFVLFGALVFLAGILFPAGVPLEERWSFLQRDVTGLRYWIIPSVSVLMLLTVAIFSKENILKYGGRVVAGFMVFALYFQFFYPPMPDYRFSEYVEKFHSMKKGETIEIPTHPVPQVWVMKLIKK